MKQTSIAYPLIFEPNLVEKIWGGKKLNRSLNKSSDAKVGESWEVSAYPNLPSIISNGELKGKALLQLFKQNPIGLMGERLAKQYTEHFPLLAKFIHAQIPLSVQVHPNNEQAKKHKSLGKNEVWYIVEAEEDACVYVGFRDDISPQMVKQAIKNKSLEDYLQTYNPKAGDVFHIPAGTVHAIGSGILIAEIQQNSDLTYRLYDWDRTDDHGNPRVLHIEEALKVLNFKKSSVLLKPNNLVQGTIAKDDFFTVSKLDLNHSVKKSTLDFDSFVIYMLLEGTLTIETQKNNLVLQQGQSMLVPYDLKDYTLKTTHAKLLEVSA